MSVKIECVSSMTSSMTSSMKSSGAVKQKMRGVGMIEILIALLVLSIGVLGYAGLQLRALRSTGESHFRTQAIAIAQDVAERISVNKTAKATYADDSLWAQTDMGLTAPADWNKCVTATCTAAQVADWDILQARWTAASLLPQGLVLGDRCAGAQTLCVTVAWNGQATADCAAGDEDCVVLEVVE